MASPLRSLYYGWVLAILPFAGLPIYGAEIAEQIKLARKDNDSNAEIELLRRLLDQNPNDTVARERVIRLWLNAPDFTMAESTLGEWKEAPPNLTALVQASVLAERDGKMDAAILRLQAYVKNSPRDTELLELLSNYLARAARWPEQIVVLDQLVELEAYASDYLSRAEAKKQVGDYAGAVRDAKRALALSPDISLVKTTVPKFERLESVFPLITSTTAALAIKPENAVELLKRGSAYLFGNVPDKALADADAAAKILPSSIYAIILKARAMSALGSREDYEIANEFLVNLGAPMETPKVAEGLIQSDVKIAASPDVASAFVNRARLLNLDQQNRLALIAAESALKLEPTNGSALLEAIYAASKSGQSDDATAYFRRLDQAKPMSESLALALGYLVESNFSASNYNQTLEFADRALKIKETESMLRYKSQALRRLGNDAEADAVMARADKLKGKAKK